MSIKVMTQVWANADVGGSELLILLAMADFSNDEGASIYPSMATLAKKARLSEKQARRVVHDLVEAGFVEIVEAGGWSGNRNRPNQYRIRLDKFGDGGTPKLSPPPNLGEGGTPKLSPPYSHRREGGTPMDGRGVLPPMGEDPLLDPFIDPPLNENGSSTANGQLWGRVIETIRSQIPKNFFESFVAPTRLRGLVDGVAVITIPTPKAQDWIENRLERQIRQLLTIETKTRITGIRVVVEEPQPM